MAVPALERIVYSTCSINQIENEDVVKSLLPIAESYGFQLAKPFPEWQCRGLPVFEGCKYYYYSVSGLFCCIVPLLMDFKIACFLILQLKTWFEQILPSTERVSSLPCLSRKMLTFRRGHIKMIIGLSTILPELELETCEGRYQCSFILICSKCGYMVNWTSIKIGGIEDNYFLSCHCKTHS